MEQKIIFSSKLDELNALAAAGGGVLKRAQVEEMLGGILNEEQLMLVFQYLEQQKIRVEGWSQSTEERLEGRRRLNLSEEAAASGFASLFAAASGVPMDMPGEAETEEDEEGTQVQSVLEQYLEELEGLSETDSGERLRLLRLASGGDMQALEQAALGYLPMICDLAGEFEKDGVLPVEDLIQEGNIALWTELSMLEEVNSLAAVEARLMNAVSTHLEEVLKQEMDEADSDQAMARKVNRLHDAMKSLEEDVGRQVSAEELSAFLEMPLEEIRNILKLAGDDIKTD